MLKSVTYRTGLLLILIACLSPFQNCGFEQGFQSRDLMSNATGTIIEHRLEDHDVVDKKEKTATQYEPILADRFYLQSLFTDIFGPLAASTDSARIRINTTEFASPCSLYEDQNTFDSTKNQWVRADSAEACGRGLLNAAQVNPKPTVSRQALVTRACSDLSSDSKTLDYALKRISNASAIPIPSEENIERLFHLFYRGKPAPQPGLIESLLVMFPKEGVTKDHWSKVIFTVCASSLWQIL